MNKFNRDDNGDIIVNLVKERSRYLDQQQFTFIQLRFVIGLMLLYFVALTCVFEMTIGTAFVGWLFDGNSILVSVIGTIASLVVIMLVLYANFKLGKWIIRYFMMGIKITYKVYDLHAKMTHDIMNTVFVHRYDNTFVLLGEYLDPVRSTGDKLVFSGMPDGFNKLSRDSFEDETEYQAMVEVSKLDLFSKEQTDNYYDQIVDLEYAKEQQAEIKRQKQLIDMKQTIRDNRGTGHPALLERRFEQAVNDLDNNFDKNEEK